VAYNKLRKAIYKGKGKGKEKIIMGLVTSSSFRPGF